MEREKGKKEGKRGESRPKTDKRRRDEGRWREEARRGEEGCRTQ